MLDKILAGVLYLGANQINAEKSWDSAKNYSGIIFPPLSKVSINLCCYHEQQSDMEVSVKSITEQNIIHKYPESFELVIIGVTGDELFSETYWRQNYSARTFRSKRGKLNARHLGISQSTGDIIVNVDADSYYPSNWLNLMLESYYKENIVATTASCRSSLFEPLYFFKHLYYSNTLLGRGSTFYKDSYYKAGGFNLSVNQISNFPIWIEEEHRFRDRIGTIGDIAYIDAPMLHLGGLTGHGLHTEVLRGKAYAQSLKEEL